MVFHPVAQEVARALNARREPPPPVVPTLRKEVLRKFGNVVLRDPARRDIAEALLILAMRLDVLGFYKPRDQLLLLAGCGLSAAEITDSLVSKRAAEAGAKNLIAKARSTSATPIEKLIAQGTDASTTGVGLRSRQRAVQRSQSRSREERLAQSKLAREARRAPENNQKPARAEPTVSGRGPAPRSKSSAARSPQKQVPAMDNEDTPRDDPPPTRQRRRKPS